VTSPSLIEVEPLRTILKMESQRNYNNSAVIGGLDKFLLRWAKHNRGKINSPKFLADFHRLQLVAPNYAAWDSQKRKAWIKDVLDWLAQVERVSGHPTAKKAPSRSKTSSHPIYDSKAPATIVNVGLDSPVTSIKGVGPKTAAIVLCFAFGKPAFPVDTHVHRVTRRLGLIGPKTTREQAHALLERLLPAEIYYSFHISLIAHGRQVCKSQRPRCESCVLQEHCDYFAARLTEAGEKETL